MYREFNLEHATPGKRCPVCHAGCFESFDIHGNTQRICPICGRFLFGSSASLFFNFHNGRKDNITYKLSHFFRSISERAFGKSDYFLFPVYNHEDLQRILDKPDPSVREKLQLLLQFIAELSQYPGFRVHFDLNTDYSVICAKNALESQFFIQTLTDQDLIVAEQELSGDTYCKLTSNGWNELERIEQSVMDSQNGFIAMWFDPTQNPTSDAIKSAITAAGYQPIRIDEVEHVNRIDDEILAKIRQSRFLVADFTGQRHGVYFEAGFMLGLGRTVIWICSKSHFAKVHFDTRQYNTIVYENTDELKTRLQFRIEAILGKGPIIT
jgi:nucleoside 2-deoxyribosyltransferase